jgi:GNAT superfamily N-acetyltransferase
MSEHDAETSGAGDLIFIEPSSGFEIRAISQSERAAVEALIRSGAIEAMAASMLAALMDIPDGQVFGGFQRGEMVAVYALRRDGMANDLALIVVAPEQRKRGVGRSLLQDALRRSGKRPLAAQTPEDVLRFFKACGFKLVGRRVQPSGDVWFRVGWHAPGSHFKGGTTNALTSRGLDSSSET